MALLLLVPMGAASIMFIATANSLLQLASSRAMRGRVMALWAMVFLGSTPIGAPLIGLLAGRYGARFALGLAASPPWWSRSGRLSSCAASASRRPAGDDVPTGLEAIAARR